MAGRAAAKRRSATRLPDDLRVVFDLLWDQEMSQAEAAGFANQTVAVLRDAVKAGFAPGDVLKGSDFDALRKRDDFQKLVNEISLKSPADDPPNSERCPVLPC